LIDFNNFDILYGNNFSNVTTAWRILIVVKSLTCGDRYIKKKIK